MENLYEKLVEGEIKKSSIIMGIPKGEDLQYEDIIIKLENNYGFKLESHKIENNTLSVSILYKNDLFNLDLNFEKVYFNQLFNIAHYLNEEEIDCIKNSEYGLCTYMHFSNNIKDSFHLQLKVISAIYDSLAGVIDYSSERILSGKWVKLACKSDIPPSPEYLFSMQAVTDENSVWIHTHGLNRCGSIELEIIAADKEEYYTLGNVIKTTAFMFIDGNIVKEATPFYLGENLIMCWFRWEDVIESYSGYLGGNSEDRENHEYPSGVLYLVEEDKPKHINHKIDYLKDNPLFFISNEETERMKMLAHERFDYFMTNYKKDNFKGLIKAGLEVDEEYKERSPLEHLWFEIIEISNLKIKAKLLNEPYFIKDLKENDIIEFNLNNMTDWILYYNDSEITPDSVYLL